MRQASAGLLATAAVALLACGTVVEEGGIVPVRMADDAFSPEVIELPAGGTLRFENLGRNPHNAFAVDGSWSTAEFMDRGERWDVTIAEPGVYEFYCTLHGVPFEGHPAGAGMAGVVIVGDVPDEQVAFARDRPIPVRVHSGVVRRVPDEHATIQEAVDVAEPGDLVLVGPGVYHEAVVVRTHSIVIRGTDRNEVILDGQGAAPAPVLANGIAVFGADGVAVENLTARNYQLNGFYWTGVTGYRGSYLTAYNNGDYGVYAFDAVDGVLEHSYASGSPDAGFYIGQCDPCRAIVNGVVAENNALGYSGTNASGELYIVGSVWRHNMAGIVPNTLDSELLPPQRETTIVANLVHDNNNRHAPAKGFGRLALGTGVTLAGGVGNLVTRNVIADHHSVGIAVATFPDDNVWFAMRNEVRDNLVLGSGRADLALVGPAGGGNCFAGNRFRTSSPPALQALAGCERTSLPLTWDLSLTTELLGRMARPAFGGEVADQPVPPPQPDLPGGADAPVRPAHDVFASYDGVDLSDLSAIPLPAAAATVTANRAQEVTVSGVSVSQPGVWQLLFGLYAYLLPFSLIASWFALAFWDLARRDDLSRAAGLGWVAAILLVPLFGVVAYHAVASKLPGWLRAAVVGGGIAAYLVVVALGAVAGGIA